MPDPLDDLKQAEAEYRKVQAQVVDLWNLQSELVDTNPTAAQMAGDAAEIMDWLQHALYLRLQSAYRVVFAHETTLAHSTSPVTELRTNPPEFAQEWHGNVAFARDGL
jgi:hypothetical protein